MNRLIGRSAVVLGALVVVWLTGAGASAQTATPTGSPATQDCADFDTQEEAQAVYDDRKDDDPNDVDPLDLDTDGDGRACEGLPSSAQATTSPTPAATTTPTPTPSGNLTETGAATGVMALSGISLLELGYGLTLLARRWGVRSRQLPVYLLRKVVRARRAGQDRIELTDDLFVVHRSVLEEEEEAEPEMLVKDPVQHSGPSVYARIPRNAVGKRDEID
ncbi:MAG: hypothetical protein WD646_08280 [Actinomycetota bacterium]